MSAFTAEGTENRMRWDRSASPFTEVWYATLTDPRTGLGLWLRYVIVVPRKGDPYCELWGAAFDPAGRRSFCARNRHPADRLAGPDGRDDGALVRIGDAWLSETHLEGEVAAGGRTLSWSLDLEPEARCFQHLPPPLRGLAERRFSVLCSPNLSVPFSGAVKLGSEVVELEGVRGCQSHRWGRGHPASWAWAHCDSFDGRDDVVFEGLAARPGRLPGVTALYLRHDGRDLAFNTLRGVLTARGHYHMPTWAFSAHDGRHRLVGAARALPGRMVQARYDDPDGSVRFCANSEIADLALELFERRDGSWRHVDSLTAMRRAHLEFGRREAFAELPVSL